METVMRMMLKVVIDTDAGNEAAQKGQLLEVTRQLVAQLDPEAAYFVPDGGQRACLIVFDMTDTSQIPVIAEPLFLARRPGDLRALHEPRGPGEGPERGLPARRFERRLRGRGSSSSHRPLRARAGPDAASLQETPSIWGSSSPGSSPRTGLLGFARPAHDRAADPTVVWRQAIEEHRCPLGHSGTASPCCPSRRGGDIAGPAGRSPSRRSSPCLWPRPAARWPRRPSP